ncbi:hypothetical protein BGZ61DRAFT_555460, partial [Ilyonectria robusta]|uniref:uncharacterized protein n=1 Tax=Ilyonectria robusta TaxID=1079257 RepID=UPI001E8EB241
PSAPSCRPKTPRCRTSLARAWENKKVRLTAAAPLQNNAHMASQASPRSTPGAVIMVPPKHREDGARGPALPAVRSNSYRRACDPRRPNRLEVVPRLISSCFGEVCGRIQHERRDSTTAITMPRLTAEHDARPVYQMSLDHPEPHPYRRSTS